MQIHITADYTATLPTLRDALPEIVPDLEFTAGAVFFNAANSSRSVDICSIARTPDMPQSATSSADGDENSMESI